MPTSNGSSRRSALSARPASWWRLFGSTAGDGFKPLRSPSLRIVWADEAEERLLAVLREVGRDGRDPMWNLGLRLLSDYSFRPPVQKAISRVCGLEDDPGGTPFVPSNSVRELAADVNLSASTLSRYWRVEVPLACSLKEFLSWAVLLWAVPRTLAGQLERHRPIRWKCDAVRWIAAACGWPDARSAMRRRIRSKSSVGSIGGSSRYGTPLPRRTSSPTRRALVAGPRTLIPASTSHRRPPAPSRRRRTRPGGATGSPTRNS